MIRRCELLGGNRENLDIIWNTTKPLPAKVFAPISDDELFQPGVITKGKTGDEEYHLGFDGNYHFAGYVE